VRNTFAAAITELATKDPRVVLLSGDIGNRLFDQFKENSPTRFLNCGVAEANMTGVAAGMALCGQRPFIYTITPFATTRALEQIRVDICYHNVPVTIVGTGSGLSYASLGPTHHSCEDISMMRCLPNMTVLCPADSAEVRAALPAVLKQNGPVYIRLGKKGEPAVHPADPPFVIGQSLSVRDGTDFCLLAVGNVVHLALEAAKLMERSGISAQVVSMHSLKPFDQARVAQAFDNSRVVATIEEHSRIGGLGSTVADWLAEHRRSAEKFLAFATPDEFFHAAGGQQYVRQQLGLTADAIARRCLDLGEALARG
jgi:transketolase